MKKSKNIYLLNDKKINFATNLPLFKIIYQKQDIDFSLYDALIFTSKNGVLAVDSFNKSWRDIPSYVISNQTAKKIKELNAKVAFIGKKGTGDKFALELIKKLKNKKTLYLRGEDVASNLFEILKSNGICCDEIVVYKNVKNEAIPLTPLPENSKVIFSSPSTVKYFFESFDWDESYEAIAIGKTTAKYIPKNIIPKIATTPSLEACVDIALKI